jgi:hypothetical protein
MNEIEIPRNKPERMLDAEWVAMHLEFREPNVSNAEYLAELKAILIESAGGRLPLPDARIRLRDYLRASGYTPSKGFPDDAPGKWIPVASGSIDDLISPERLDWTLKHQMEVLYGARDKYAGNDPHRLDSFPGWMLMKRAGANADDLRDRWKRAGGAFYQPLLGGRCPDTEETGMIALKNDPVWARLGSSSLFSDAVDIDHPPFYLNSGLCCKEVDRWELEEMGILSTEARMSKDNSLDPAIRHAFERSTGIGLIPENRERILEVIRLRRMTRKAERYKLAEEAVQKASEAYAKSNNSEAELARAMVTVKKLRSLKFGFATDYGMSGHHRSQRSVVRCAAPWGGLRNFTEGSNPRGLSIYLP